MNPYDFNPLEMQLLMFSKFSFRLVCIVFDYCLQFLVFLKTMRNDNIFEMNIATEEHNAK